MPFFRSKPKPRVEPRLEDQVEPEQQEEAPPPNPSVEDASTSQESIPADLLRGVTIRQHAALVGLLSERLVLITGEALYVVDGRSPDVDRILHVDTGLLWIALSKRLGGDTAAAEDAIREAVWRWAKMVGTDMDAKGTADIDLSGAEVMVKHCQERGGNWFVDVLGLAFRYLHPEAAMSPQGIGAIWGDAWRLYAGALSALGDATSRRVPGDEDDYREPG